MWLKQHPIAARIALVAVMLGLLASSYYVAKRWWNKRPYMTNLPEYHQIIDGQPSRFKSLFECLEGQAQCPQQITPLSTYQFRVLGNPAARRYPKPEQWTARTPWDLFISDNRLYVGLGDASNDGPTPNAGPVPIIAYDLARNEFIEEAVLLEEQIDRFYTVENQLMIPGEDSRESWDWGNLYVQQSNGHWQQRRTIPRFIHAHTLAFYKGRLYAGGNIPDAIPKGIGEQRHGSAVASSSDLGIHWQTTGLGGWRVSEFLQVKGNLYAVDAFAGPGLQAWLTKQGRQSFYSAIYQLGDTSNWIRRTDLNAEIMLPDTPLAGKRMAIIERSVFWKDTTFYIAAFVTKPGELAIRVAYQAINLNSGHVSVSRLPFSDNTQVWDIASDDTHVWISTATPGLNGRWLNQLHKSTDGHQWQTVLAFEAPTYARSFALNGTSIYWGLAGEQYAGTLLEFYPF
jgi:hypothetical protein